MISLDELGIHFNTDKSSVTHGYLGFYEPFLAPIRQNPVKFLEIGVLAGASLAVWEAYFPNGTIIGADIDRTALRFQRDRVLVEIIDQSNIEHLARLAMRHGPFDVIIDDGSHKWEHQITGLRTLFPFLKNMGYYIIEDLQTNYGDLAAGYRGTATLSCVEYLKKLVDLRVGDEQLDPALEEDAFLRTYAAGVRSITFARHACVIQKDYHDQITGTAAGQWIEADGKAPILPLALVAHVARQGDTPGEAGCVRATRQGQGIEGFALTVPQDPPCRVEYRARSAAGLWGAWVTDGAYAGTRGQSDTMTGFSVRLAEAHRHAFKLQAAAQFADSDQVFRMSDDGDCVSPSGRHALTGMQIVISPK